MDPLPLGGSGVYARRRAELTARAAAGDADAMKRLRANGTHRKYYRNLRDRAANGDEEAIRKCDKRRTDRAKAKQKGRKAATAAKVRCEGSGVGAIETHQRDASPPPALTPERTASVNVGVTQSGQPLSTAGATSPDTHTLQSYHFDADNSDDDEPLMARHLRRRPVAEVPGGNGVTVNPTEPPHAQHNTEMFDASISTTINASTTKLITNPASMPATTTETV